MTATTLTPPSTQDTVPATEVRRSTSGRGRQDTVLLLGALVSATALTAILFNLVISAPGVIGFVVVDYLVFLLLYGVLVSLGDNGLTVRDKLASAIIHGLALLTLGALLYSVGFVFWRGREALSHLNFFYQDMRKAGPLEPLTVGGILHAAAGTLIEIAIALTITVPLGLACAVYLNEVRGAFPRFVRTISEAMTALPSIVAGLFIYASVILTLGVERSGFAAGLALSVMMLPIVIRASDVVLRLVPGSLREASLAVGAGQWRTMWHVVLPTARSGLTTAVLLGTARGIGETSPVLLTAGFGAGLNVDPTQGPMVSLPLAAFTFAASPEPNMVARGFGAAAVLLALVFVLFALARVLGGRPPGQLSNRQRRRRARRSVVDAGRFAAYQRRSADG